LLIQINIVFQLKLVRNLFININNISS